MKRITLTIASLLLTMQASAIGLTQSAAALSILPTGTLAASISGVGKEVLYKDGTEFVMRGELDAQNAQPSLALKQELDQYIQKNSLSNVDYLKLTIDLINMEAENDAQLLIRN
jgi:hypothetical protein